MADLPQLESTLTVIGVTLVTLCTVAHLARLVLLHAKRRDLPAVDAEPLNTDLEEPLNLPFRSTISSQPEPPEVGAVLEGRIENRLELLDELVTEADREIDHLGDLLNQMCSRDQLDEQTEADSSRPEKSPPTLSTNTPSIKAGVAKPALTEAAGPHVDRPVFTEQQRAMIRCLGENGYDAQQISRLLGCRPKTILIELDAA